MGAIYVILPSRYDTVRIARNNWSETSWEYFWKKSEITKVFRIAKRNWRKKTFKLTLYSVMSQNGQTHFKDLAANAARFLKCVWPFMTLRSKGLSNINQFQGSIENFGTQRNTYFGTLKNELFIIYWQIW